MEHASQWMKRIVGAENVKVMEPMQQHTSFRVGGPADLLVTPQNSESICEVLSRCRQEGLPVLIMGNGTNLVVRDKGIRGVVIKLFDNFNRYSVTEDTIEAEAGILLSKISNIALKHSLGGLEFASGIPGTLGGAVAMNAGAYGGEMKDVVIRTQYVDLDGNVRTLEGDSHQFRYRSSYIQKSDGLVLKSVLKLRRTASEEIKALMDDLNRRRVEKQPLSLPSAGSVFKRPEGYFAGKLIEDCGLKGFKIGGAEVSAKHCGFIVNTGGATADDIIRLIEHIRSTVKEKHGVELETEVRFVGEA